MYFTREPIVETVITSKEGFKLVLRNSKGGGQEEFVVDAVEVICFGKNCFYRSLEKPKSFILPISDYEIVEARETKMVLKTPSVEKGGIKIGGGREGNLRPLIKEEEEKKEQLPQMEEERKAGGDRKRDRRRFRKRKERDEEAVAPPEEGEVHSTVIREERHAIIPPPTTLISETISRYKDLPGFSGAFFDREEKLSAQAVEDEMTSEEYLPSDNGEVQVSVESKEEGLPEDNDF